MNTHENWSTLLKKL